MRTALCLLGLACWPVGDPASVYQLQVTGAISASAEGRAEPGPSGTADEPYYTIALGGPEATAAVVFTRPGGRRPEAGAFPVGDAEFTRGGFSALIITGAPAHPTGVFRVERGTLTITGSGPERLTGRFALRATGFRTETPAVDNREITAVGSFSARASRPPPLPSPPR